MSTDELACTYAALILHDEGLEITADKISALVKSAELEVEGFYPALFAKFLTKSPLGDIMTNVGGAAAPAGAPAAAAGGAADAAPKEEKKAEPADESDEAMEDFGLFD
ncbi:60S acidic ribosomal protein P1 [Diplonema papillatum]|nr:60S acidic ribosomal protein P1 [Diplonema papillatum]KAJ9456715.1 60S acidic ribosomal protein P1 [Diplonema papillatum]